MVVILTTFLEGLIAGASTLAFVALWFWVVRQELHAKQKAEDSARCQLIASKQGYMRARNSPEEIQAQQILQRSEQVYNQSVQLYNEALHKPWNVVPAALMGFHITMDNTEI